MKPGWLWAARWEGLGVRSQTDLGPGAAAEVVVSLASDEVPPVVDIKQAEMVDDRLVMDGSEESRLMVMNTS